MRRKVIVSLVAIISITSTIAIAPIVSAKDEIKAIPISHSLIEKEDENHNLVICPAKLGDSVEYDKIFGQGIPKEFNEIIEACKYNKGYLQYRQKDSSDIYVAILGGEKPNPAYGIEVKSVEENNGTININVEEIIPSPYIKIAQVISYPYTVIKIKDTGNKIIIRDNLGKVYKDSRLRHEENDIIKEKENNLNNFIFRGLLNIFLPIK